MKNRWLIALSAIGIHICIGSVYAWSVLTKPIMQAMGFTLKRNDLDFFDRNFISRTVSGIFGRLR